MNKLKSFLNLGVTSTSTGPSMTVAIGTATTLPPTSAYTIFPAELPSAEAASKNVENAVYAHLRAVRALGKTEVGMNEIARALSLSPAQVEDALSKLRSKGVKFAASR